MSLKTTSHKTTYVALVRNKMVIWITTHPYSAWHLLREGDSLRNLPLRIPTNENVDIQSMNIDYLAQTLIDQLGKNHVNYVMPYYYLTPDE